MALYTNPADHTANPPETWSVTKRGDRSWALVDQSGAVFDTFTTRHAALAAKVSGFYVTLYAKETRYFAGEQVPGWKLYAPKVTVSA